MNLSAQVFMLSKYARSFVNITQTDIAKEENKFVYSFAFVLLKFLAPCSIYCEWLPRFSHVGGAWWQIVQQSSHCELKLRKHICSFQHYRFFFSFFATALKQNEHYARDSNHPTSIVHYPLMQRQHILPYRSHLE